MTTAERVGLDVTDWRATLPDDMLPVALAKGWRSPAEALRSYVHLERLIGVDKIAPPPRDARGRRAWRIWSGWEQMGLRPVGDAKGMVIVCEDGSAILFEETEPAAEAVA